MIPLLSALLLAACAPATPAPAVLRLATTTSTDDSGLLDAILPAFERDHNARVEVVAVGTGQALALGARGDADVVLVHARAQEDAFMAAGDGLERRDVMYNDFVIAGPAEDPAGVAGAASAAGALARIAQAEAPWASRGDKSGTHTKELSLWAAAAISPTAAAPTAGSWYAALGQGMGETLVYANEQGAYTLADRGTFIAMRDRLPRLAVLFGGATIADNSDPALLNPYGVIVVNPAKHPGVNASLAGQFAAWLTSPETQAAIGAFGKDRYGQPLFYPAAGGSVRPVENRAQKGRPAQRAGRTARLKAGRDGRRPICARLRPGGVAAGPSAPGFSRVAWPQALLHPASAGWRGRRPFCPRFSTGCRQP